MKDEDKDVELGRQLYKSMKQEKIHQEEGKRANNVAMYFCAFLGIILFISITIILLGGPK